MKYQGIKGLVCGCMIAMIALTGCTNTQENTEQSEPTSSINQTDDQKAEADIFAMDTYMNVTAFGENAEQAVQAAEQEIYRLDALLGANDAQSEVGQINQNGGGVCSEDTAYLLERSMQLYEDTEGVFNVMLYPVIEAWGFISKDYAVPSEDTLNTLLPLTDMAQVSYDPKQKEVKFLQDGMKIGFGGIAKGYLSAKIMDIFEEYDINSGIVNLGGNVQVKGTKVDGTDWRVGIQDPHTLGETLGVLAVNDKAVITSGGYERYFEQDGKIYHHILDPSTGKTANNGLVSVTIVSDDGALADGLSTSLFVMGREKAEQYWQNHADEFETILVTEDGAVYITEGLADQFETDTENVFVIEKK